MKTIQRQDLNIPDVTRPFLRALISPSYEIVHHIPVVVGTWGWPKVGPIANDVITRIRRDPRKVFHSPGVCGHLRW